MLKAQLKKLIYGNWPKRLHGHPRHQAWRNFEKVRENPSYVPQSSTAHPTSLPVRTIAFYLPQFHTIPENDQWWGKGFTEWTNVRSGTPQFTHHYQPHVPDDLDYYDLRNTETQYKQVRLAKQYGISAFCFYFYWFKGKRLLETPTLNYLKTPDLNLPFCLCWANENWTRRWDGKEQDILIAQAHSPEDDLAFIQHIAQYLRDERYIRIDGKPLLIIYRPALLPDARATTKRWRDWCRKNNIGEIYLACTQSFETTNPQEFGYDAAIEFPPNQAVMPKVNPEAHPTITTFHGELLDWKTLVHYSKHYPETEYTLFKTVCPSWDNTARRKSHSRILCGSSPAGYKEWLSNATKWTVANIKNPDERLVFINAWNEWAEGAHLEPDQRYGYAWLQATRDALTE